MCDVRNRLYNHSPSTPTSEADPLVAPYKSEGAQFVNYYGGVLFNSAIYCIKRNLWIFWRLIWIINACESFDLSSPCFGIYAFGITVLADFKGGIHVDLKEIIGTHHAANVVPR